jgi:hypothetical protein
MRKKSEETSLAPISRVKPERIRCERAGGGPRNCREQVYAPTGGYGASSQKPRRTGERQATLFRKSDEEKNQRAVQYQEFTNVGHGS